MRFVVFLLGFLCLVFFCGCLQKPIATYSCPDGTLVDSLSKCNSEKTAESEEPLKNKSLESQDNPEDEEISESTTDKDKGKEGTDTGTTGGDEETGNVDTGETNGDTEISDTETSDQIEEKDFWDYFDSEAVYKVDYTVTSTGAGADSSITMTMYVSGEKSRTDVSVEGTETRTYLLDNEIYICSQTGGTWMCLSLGSAETTSQDELEANQATYTPISMPDKTIAGETGHCYKLNDVEGYDMEYCFSDDGAILWTKTSGEGMTTEMIATSYSTSVTDADFVLPAEVTEAEEKDFWDYFDSDVGYKVDYTVTSTGTGADTTLTMTMYVYGEDSRTDTSAQGMEARTYIVDNKMYVCSNSETWMCFSMGAIPETSAEELEANQAAYTPISMPDKTIAGETGHCYKLNDVEGYDMEYCFSDDGAILWTKTSGEGMTTEMIATSYSTSVTDADFVLPAEVTEMPTYE